MSDNKKFFGMEVDNTINIGDMLTMVGIFSAVVVISFGVWRDLYDRTNSNYHKLVVVENEISNMKLQAQIDRRDIKDSLKEIKLGITNVRNLIDKKADK